MIYGYRAHGPYNPQEGHRFNPHKLLLDPYAKQFAGSLRWSDALFGYRINSPRGDLSLDRRDSAQGMLKAVVTENSFDWGDDRPPNVPWSSTVIYEAHHPRHVDAAARHPRQRTRHIRRARRSGNNRLSAVARDHRAGIVAHPRLRAGSRADRARLAELLGLQFDRLLCGRAALFIGRFAERNACRRAPAARRRHRGHSRRRLQPHRGRQRAWSDAIIPRPRQCQLLPAGTRQQAALHQRHRDRQHAQSIASARAANGDGFAALLGDVVPRRRLPLRPRASRLAEKLMVSIPAQASSMRCAKTRS